MKSFSFVVFFLFFFFLMIRRPPRSTLFPYTTALPIFSRTAAALREHEDVTRGFVDSIRGLYAGAETVVITEQGNPRSYPWYRHAMFYLPDYAVYELQVGGLAPGFRASRLSTTMMTTPETVIQLPAGVERLVWFIDHWSPTTVRPPGLVEME